LLMQQYVQQENVPSMAALCTELLNMHNTTINLYLATAIARWIEFAPNTFLPVLVAIARVIPPKPIYQEAIVSSLSGFEKDFRDSLAIANKTGQSQSGYLDSLLNVTIKNRHDKKMNPIFVEARMPVDSRTNGLTLYRNNCSSCHGADGDGIELVAPPLKNSEYVTGSTSRLAMIILNGVEGPIHVNGQLYNLNNTMPTFANNLTDDQVADIIRFVHNSFVTTPVKPLDAAGIGKLRLQKTKTLTEKDLIEIGRNAK
jgi:mono/diheme cytochrome c family protein